MPVPKPRKKDEAYEEEWLITYADAMTLVLCFFITIVSISKVDVQLLEQLSSSFSMELGGQQKTAPVTILREQLQQKTSDVEILTQADIFTDPQGVVIELHSPTLFEGPGAQLKANARTGLGDVISQMLKSDYATFEVLVEGHVNTGQNAGPNLTAWELSALRASAVVRVFTEIGITSDRMSAIGMADAHPTPEIDPEAVRAAAQTQGRRGTALSEEETEKRVAEAQARVGKGAPDNDRIVIRLRPKLDASGKPAVPVDAATAG